MTDHPIAPPLAVLAELTHRCPLQCPYCSNPQELLLARDELSTDVWKRVIDEAAELGALQIHFSGGEPTARRDLRDLIAHAQTAGLYSNLITSGVLLDQPRFGALVEAGLDHVQLSIQDVESESAERIGHYPDAQRKKLAFAGWVGAAGLPLTINAVVHRQNLDRLDRVIELAVALGAGRVEVAHVQYYGWALRNREALMPTRAQIDAATATVEAARQRLAGRLVIDYVVPDYYARRPKACMGGWGRQFINITPNGRALPCHAAETIEGLIFDSIAQTSLSEIWQSSPAFQRFRGTDWMPDPCRSCARREIDWGGCRCQALALTGRAESADPACELSSDHRAMLAIAEGASSGPAPSFAYRRMRQPLPS